MFTDISRKFEKMGAGVEFRVTGRPRASRTVRPAPLTINITSKNGRELFDIVIHADFKDSLDLQVLQVLPREQHLVLVARELDEDGSALKKHHFLCGHDERHWFVAGVSGVSTVDGARDSLKPDEIRRQESSQGLNRKRRNLRRNEIFVRQGEWFFMPSPGLPVDSHLIRKNEPMRRTGQRGGKAHWAEFAFRSGGEVVKVCDKYPNGLTMAQYRKLIKMRPQALKLNWIDMRRNAALYVKGRITHADHATVVLADWHRVMMNTERGTETVVFLD